MGAWTLNIAALGLGAALGARALIDPKWAARFVRLQADAQPGGFAEFRATYGGLFFVSHAAALCFSLDFVLGGESLSGVYAAGAAAVLAAAWAGSCGGRVIAMWRDKARTNFNLLSAAVEAILALAIAAPWLLRSFSVPG